MLLTEYGRHKDSKLKDRLFWDMDMTKFDYEKNRLIVVERVVEYGDMEDWWAILNMYGEQVVKDEIKQINMLTDKNIKFVSGVFGIPLDEMKSYQNKLEDKKHWRE